MATAQPSDGYKDRFRPTVGWVTYDLANTIFSFMVVTAFGSVYLEKIAGKDVYFGAANTISMVAAGLLVPVLGAISDRSGHSKKWIFAFTLICCTSTILYGLFPTGNRALAITMLVVFFVIANFSFQSSLVFYNSFLPELASKKRLGFVSGLGIGVGYAGNILGIATALVYFSIYGKNANPWPLFITTGVLFFLFALPCFIWVRERKIKDPEPISGALVGRSFKELWRTLRSLPSHKALMLFLIGNFLCMDGLNTTIVCATRTLTEVMGLDKEAFTKVLLGFSVTALAVGLVLGKLIDVIGSWKTFYISGAAFTVALIVCSLVQQKAIFIGTFIALGPIGLAGIQAAGRKILIELAPPEKIGEYFGLFGLTNKVSALGVLIFFIITDALGGDAFAFRIGLAFLLLFVVPGIICVAFAGKAHRRTTES